jgi:hypothetical protein
MGKKRTSEEVAKIARENGFDDYLTSIDDRPVFRETLPYTNGLYDMQLDLWDEKVLS